MISLECKHCNKKFLVKPYRKTTAVCCSRSCLWYITKHIREAQRLKSIKNKKSHNNKQIEIICKTCKKPFLISPSRIYTRKFCSKNCYTIASIKEKKATYKKISLNGIRILEHRHIMELYLNRKLSSDEHVHHINHNHLDNRIENLEILSISEHAKKHRRTF